MAIRMTRSGRRHKVGLAHALAALIDAGEPLRIVGDQAHYVGTDDRGVELHLILVPDNRGGAGDLAIVHCQPTAQRRP